MSSPPLAYDIAEACRLAGGVGRTTLYAAIKRGDLAIIKIGRRTLITAQALDAWLKKAASTVAHAPEMPQ